MLSDYDLKNWLQRDLPRADKALLVVATFSQPANVADIKLKAQQVGCRMEKWNVADVLAKNKGMTIRLPTGYEVAEKGRVRLKELGVTKLAPSAQRVADDLRNHLKNIQDETTKTFVEEAIKCYEADLYRSAIVMAWLAAVGVLQREVAANHLSNFNAELKSINPKWKPAINADDLSKLGEREFLDRLVSISVIGKNVKSVLVQALDLRNGCGHPNSLKVGANSVASHIEVLLLNVFEKFSV